MKKKRRERGDLERCSRGCRVAIEENIGAATAAQRCVCEVRKRVVRGPFVQCVEGGKHAVAGAYRGEAPPRGTERLLHIAMGRTQQCGKRVPGWGQKCIDDAGEKTFGNRGAERTLQSGRRRVKRSTNG